MANRELIVVGVDGTDGGRRALRWAMEEGKRTGGTVAAVTAWYWDGVDFDDVPHAGPAEQRAKAERVSARDVNQVLAEFAPTVTVVRQVAQGHPEEVLYSHPAVADAAVFGVPDARFGEEITAVVSLKPGASVEPEELVMYCRDRMASYKYPRALEIRDELPKTSTGKIAKLELRQEIAGRR